MSRKKTETLRKLNVRHQRMRSRTEHMRTANRLGFCLLIIAVCVAVPVTALPALNKVKADNAHYETHWLGLVQEAADAKDYANRDYRAIQQDSRYLEIKARERLSWSKPGERILVFPKIEKDKTKQRVQ